MDSNIHTDLLKNQAHHFIHSKFLILDSCLSALAS